MSKLAHSNDATMAAIETQENEADCQYLPENMRNDICEACGREIEGLTECYRVVCPYQNAAFAASSRSEDRP